MRKNAARDIDIYICREWGEPLKVLADRYKISVSRVESIVASQRFLARMAYPYCVVCGHSGSMHHDADWQYDRGPCAEYLCDCPAMDGGHD